MGENCFYLLNKRNGHTYAASRTDYQFTRGLIGQIAYILEGRDSFNLAFNLFAFYLPCRFKHKAVT